MKQNLICIDFKCTKRRLISNMDDQFLHSDCEIILQLPQFILCLQNSTKCNKQELLEYLESQIYDTYSDFENRMISQIQQFVNVWKEDFIDRIANQIFDEIKDYQFFNINNFENDIKNPYFIDDCLRVLDNKYDFPPKFYLNQHFQFQTQQFDHILYQLDEILQYSLCVEEFLSNNQSVDFFENGDFQEPILEKIPLKGYKGLQAEEYYDSFEEDQFSREIQQDSFNYNDQPSLHDFQEPPIQQQQPQIPLKGYKSQINDNEGEAKAIPLKGYKTDNNMGTYYNQSKIPKTTNRDQSKTSSKKVKKKTQQNKNSSNSQKEYYEEKQYTSDFSKQPPKQSTTKESRNLNPSRLPAFSEVNVISIFHKNQTVGNIEISKKKTVARCISNLGNVLFEGFLKVEKTYKIKLQLSKCNSRNKNYVLSNIIQFAEIGIIDWDIFEYPKNSTKTTALRGVYSVNSLGKIHEDGEKLVTKLDLKPLINITVEFQGQDEWLVFQAKGKSCKIDIRGISNNVSLFAQLENAQLLIRN